jgi:hypothetical protein
MARTSILSLAISSNVCATFVFAPSWQAPKPKRLNRSEIGCGICMMNYGYGADIIFDTNCHVFITICGGISKKIGAGNSLD